MSNDSTSFIGEEQVKREWMEPTVYELDVQQTAGNKGTGGDGATGNPDCTLS